MKFNRTNLVKNVVDHNATSYILNENKIVDIVTINEIDINNDELDKVLSEVIFTKENLEHVFLKSTEDLFDYQNILKTFIPSNIEDPKFEEEFIKRIEDNKNYYSFFAEALMAVVFRDVMNYNLVSAVLDTTRTLVDSETGVDACMIDYDNKKIVLGEAKFYQGFKEGIDKISNDFTRPEGFLNKLENLLKNISSNREAKSIIIKDLSENIFYDLSINDLFKISFVFAGFVLHGAKNDVDIKKLSEVYNNKSVNINQILVNIKENIGEIFENKIEIVLFNLPTKSKKELIKKIINNARGKLKELKESHDN